MIGAIIGDIVGSRFEWNNHRSKEFELITDECFFTDDTVMSIAICDALLESNIFPDIFPDFFKDKEAQDEFREKVIEKMISYGRSYPGRGYGEMFSQWISSECPEPYYSFGNGAAMRVGAVGYVSSTISEAFILSDIVTRVTHNHPEGIKGARTVSGSIVYARRGDKQGVAYLTEMYYGKFKYSLDTIRGIYKFDETCQGTVPFAVQAFLDSTSYEDAIRNAISIGGDSDTIACITGAIAEAYYGIPLSLRNKGLKMLDEKLRSVVEKFELRYGF